MPTLKGAFLSVPVALCSILIVASGQSGKGPLPIPESESEDIYAVYSAVVRHELGPRNGNRLLLTPATIVRDDSVCLKQAIKEREAADREQVSQYLERSRFSYQLLRKLDPGLPFELAKSGSPDEAAQPSGLRVSVSAVGFDSHRNKAVVYLECCGTGGIHFLTKLDRKWTCDPQRMPWPCMWIAWHLARRFSSLAEMRLPLATAAHMRDNWPRKQGMLDWNTCKVVERHPGRVSGACVFRGTRVPVSALFANIEGGATVEEFLEWFPGVSREQVHGVLEHAAHSLATPEAA